MKIILLRILSLARKEALVVLRDPRGRLLLIVPPLIQLIIFSFAVTLEVKNVDLLVHNEDPGRHGREITARLEGSSVFRTLTFVSRSEEFRAALDQRLALAAVRLPRDFSRKIESGEGAAVEVIYDGRRSNAAQIVNSYLTRLAAGYNQELTGGPPAVEVAERHWFNENLDYLWFTIPSLAAILTVIITIILASMSVAREREMGTFDQLLVSPLTPLEILIGKVGPAMFIGLAEGLLIFACGRLFFQVPFRGSPAALVLVLAAFSFSIVGFGLFISSLARTQQQAILGAFMFAVPAIALSGFAAPVENMPLWLQNATWINPVKHALILLKGLYLKALPWPEVLASLWPLAVIGAVTVTVAGRLFARRLQ